MAHPPRAAALTTAVALVAALGAAACATPRPVDRAPAADPLAPERVAPLRAFIKQSWGRLTRGPADLPQAARDDKLPHAAGTPWLVYLPADEDVAAVEARLAPLLPASRLGELALRPLPPAGSAIAPHGLLYLPRRYVVPGGRFNEMYGWDSAFIVLGLLRDGEAALARDIIDDFLYEVRHYGGVLNANRSYYLTRSQPPLLSQMVLALYRVTGDRVWLAGARRARGRPRSLDRPAPPRPGPGAVALLRPRRGPRPRGSAWRWLRHQQI
jgi:alpha,alpha-trehalase